jgi:peptide/nickel transport system permease protein
VGSVIIAEASLSFLGLGVPAPTATWGGMISQGGRAFMFQNSLIIAVPAIALGTVVLAFNLAGDALRDVLDPRLNLR